MFQQSIQSFSKGEKDAESSTYSQVVKDKDAYTKYDNMPLKVNSSL